MRWLGILLASLKFRIQTELAYIGNFWLELVSTFFFVLTYIVFIDILFRRVGEVAAYDKNDFLFMSLVGQLTFYTVSRILAPPMGRLVATVRTGEFDLTLLKPAPTRLLLYSSSWRPLYMLYTSVPNIAIYVWLIEWQGLVMTWSSLAMGAVVWLCGVVIFSTFMFMLAYPVFTQGDATDLVGMWWSTMSMTEFPYDKLPSAIKALSLSVLPGLLMTAGSTQVILNKSDTNHLLLGASIVGAIFALIVYSFFWSRAMLNYSSASS